MKVVVYYNLIIMHKPSKQAQFINSVITENYLYYQEDLYVHIWHVKLFSFQKQSTSRKNQKMRQKPGKPNQPTHTKTWVYVIVLRNIIDKIT